MNQWQWNTQQSAQKATYAIFQNLPQRELNVLKVSIASLVLKEMNPSSMVPWLTTLSTAILACTVEGVMQVIIKELHRWVGV